MSFARNSKKRSTEFVPVKRDLVAARKGFSEEFPLLCAKLGASIIPQVMILDPITEKLVPLEYVQEDSDESKTDQFVKRGIRRSSLIKSTSVSRTPAAIAASVISTAMPPGQSASHEVASAPSISMPFDRAPTSITASALVAASSVSPSPPSVVAPLISDVIPSGSPHSSVLDENIPPGAVAPRSSAAAVTSVFGSAIAPIVAAQPRSPASVVASFPNSAVVPVVASPRRSSAPVLASVLDSEITPVAVTPRLPSSIAASHFETTIPPRPGLSSAGISTPVRATNSAMRRSRGSRSSPVKLPPWLTPQSMEKPCPPPSPYVLVSLGDTKEEQKGKVITRFALKGFQIDEAIVKALTNCLAWYDTINEISLHDCGLTAKIVEILAKSLRNAKNVTHLNLDGNPVPEQNFYLLLEENTGLRSLSLRFCEINDVGAYKMSEALKYRDAPHNQTLLHLNLYENNIGNQGLISLSQGLRTNRTLLELILSRNSIGDSGASGLASVIMKFPLTTEELRSRKKRSIDRDSCRENMLRKKLKDMKYSRFENMHEYAHNKLKLTTHPVTNEDFKKATSEVFNEVSFDKHPYVWDARPEGQDMWCIGNLHLKIIDLGYNKISAIGAHKFLEAIEYQAKMRTTERRLEPETGAVTIVLQGNPTPKNCFELDRIQEIISAPLRERYPPKRHITQSHISRKKATPSSSSSKLPKYTLQEENDVTFKYSLKDVSPERGQKGDSTRKGRVSARNTGTKSTEGMSKKSKRIGRQNGASLKVEAIKPKGSLITKSEKMQQHGTSSKTDITKPRETHSKRLEKIQDVSSLKSETMGVRDFLIEKTVKPPGGMKRSIEPYSKKQGNTSRKDETTQFGDYHLSKPKKNARKRLFLEK